MNIKSLLLGSAAALAVVSGAQAADAIVAAEPEPMEYVRVCDAFGTGYFYIPGTETCIKIGGKVRYDAEAADSYTPDSDNGWRKKSRAEITVDTASDTEWGALKTNIIARWDWTTGGRSTSGPVFDADGVQIGTADDIGLGNTDAKLIAANITLGGFLVGLADSQYSAFPGYAGDIINDDVISYGQFERNQISYTYDAGNGFSIVGAFEDRGQFGNNEYLPNMVAGVGYTTGAFGFHLVGGYDAEVEEGGIKGRIDATFGSFSAFYMAAWNSDGDTTNAYAPGDSIGQSWGDWAMWGGVGAKFTDNLGANFQAALTDNDTIALAANLKWEVVPGLLIQPEVTWTKWDGEDGGAGTFDVDDDQWNGMVRFQRSF
ncbi:porin [Rhizobiaceae bacterium n13]|uniref:Porin n=1 Tax=Ferirhizobium litorale TaxID=2927786 RepID=A0AAE3U163_9HYPH|nr:porin [Fererhizobium litorale]MDI7861150.1 porin [Fererhizobium litorale]MDI7921297.1 porin [Fererhizobium litorale]